jgi:phage-related protein
MIEAWVEVDGIEYTFVSLGLGVKRHDIPVLPDTIDYSIAIAGEDGEIDFGSVYGPRTFNIECVLMANDPTLDYQSKIAMVAVIFNAKKGDRIFRFGDLPGKRYKARYAGTFAIEKLIFDGNINIPLKMHDPYPEALRDTSVIEYGQGLEYGQGYEYSSYSTLITSNGQSFSIDNIGSVEAAPLIRISGKLTTLSLSDGSKTFTFGGVMSASDVLEIDCNPRKCTVKLNNANAFSQTNGVFLLLKPGITTFAVNAISPNFTIEFIFRHKYLY